MNTTRTIRHLVASSTLFALASVTSLASADLVCRTVWPSFVNHCKANNQYEVAPAVGANGAGSNRQLIVHLLRGNTATISALDANGLLLSNCSVTDSSATDGFAATKTCSSAAVPIWMDVYVD